MKLKKQQLLLELVSLVIQLDAIDVSWMKLLFTLSIQTSECSVSFNTMKCATFVFAIEMNH